MALQEQPGEAEYEGIEVTDKPLDVCNEDAEGPWLVMSASKAVDCLIMYEFGRIVERIADRPTQIIAQVGVVG